MRAHAGGGARGLAVRGLPVWLLRNSVAAIGHPGGHGNYRRNFRPHQVTTVFADDLPYKSQILPRRKCKPFVWP